MARPIFLWLVRWIKLARGGAWVSADWTTGSFSSQSNVPATPASLMMSKVFRDTLAVDALMISARPLISADGSSSSASKGKSLVSSVPRSICRPRMPSTRFRTPRKYRWSLGSMMSVSVSRSSSSLRAVIAPRGAGLGAFSASGNGLSPPRTRQGSKGSFVGYNCRDCSTASGAAPIATGAMLWPSAISNTAAGMRRMSPSVMASRPSC